MDRKQVNVSAQSIAEFLRQNKERYRTVGDSGRPILEGLPDMYVSVVKHMCKHFYGTCAVDKTTRDETTDDFSLLPHRHILSSMTKRYLTGMHTIYFGRRLVENEMVNLIEHRIANFNVPLFGKIFHIMVRNEDEISNMVDDDSLLRFMIYYSVNINKYEKGVFFKGLKIAHNRVYHLVNEIRKQPCVLYHDDVFVLFGHNCKKQIIETISSHNLKCMLYDDVIAYFYGSISFVYHDYKIHRVHGYLSSQGVMPDVEKTILTMARQKKIKSIMNK